MLHINYKIPMLCQSNKERQLLDTKNRGQGATTLAPSTPSTPAVPEPEEPNFEGMTHTRMKDLRPRPLVFSHPADSSTS